MQMRIIVIGGGIGGLAAALTLSARVSRSRFLSNPLNCARLARASRSVRMHRGFSTASASRRRCTASACARVRWWCAAGTTAELL